MGRSPDPDPTLATAETLAGGLARSAVHQRLPRTIGRYEVRGLLGQGGTARVYRAYDPERRRQVAVKVLKEPLAADARIVARFRREGETAARLRHPGLVALLDVGPDFLVLELVPGESLAARLAGRGPLSPGETLSVLDWAGSALDHVHGQGVVHRDVKPSNVMVLREGGAKLADFGVARLAWARMTRSGELIGSPAYMAPEHIVHGRVGPASDIYALGLVAYEALTGHRAFPGERLAELMRSVAHTEPLPVRALQPDLPPAVDVVFARALAKDPARRFHTAAEFVAGLRRAFVSGEAGSARR